MSLNAKTVADNIAGLSVTGVTLKALDEIIETVESRHTPLFQPEPRNFFSNLRLERSSLNIGASNQWDVTYNLDYAFFYAPVGSSRSLLDVYEDMTVKALAVLDVILVNDYTLGAVDVRIVNVSEFGAIPDPSGNMHHGCTVTLEVTELEG